MFAKQHQNGYCLSVASLPVWVEQIQLISERNSGLRVSFRTFLVGTRKVHNY